MATSITRRRLYLFIVTDNVGGTESCIPCLSKYTESFSNVYILTVARLLAMSKFFASVNEVESHNKSRHSGLALNIFWVNQCGWMQLSVEVSMGITITKLWRLFRYGVNRYNYEKLIGIR